jgi:hypothetical protein
MYGHVDLLLTDVNDTHETDGSPAPRATPVFAASRRAGAGDFAGPFQEFVTRQITARSSNPRPIMACKGRFCLVYKRYVQKSLTYEAI